MRFGFLYICMTILAKTKYKTKKKMGSKSPNIAALVLPLLLILFSLSSQARLVESSGRKLAWAFGGAPIIGTPSSNSCGASPAIWYPKPTNPRPCRRTPGIGIPTSHQSP
ncbi:hypothetical protein IGI04_021510 [Brassica rapa subsp. trilocularis]|nr:hypothetical protein IGI04_021510 [Brassica rapa subsp. trilocularis]